MLYGCAGLPPGADFVKPVASALPHPELTRLGQQFADTARAHQGKSGFRMIQAGVDGFLLRMQMINAAERSLDLQLANIAALTSVASSQTLRDIINGRLTLIWAHGQLLSDSPDKNQVEKGVSVGRLMNQVVASTAQTVKSELLIITPYLIPGSEGMPLFADLRQHAVRIRLLTNSLNSSEMLLAQSTYMHYRQEMLEQGVELYEIKAFLANSRGSGQTPAISRYGNYSLHAKLFVFDRQKLFIGSMNFDQRSMHVNTEIGLIIDSPALAEQVAARFAAMVQPGNCYQLAFQANRLVWRTAEAGQAIEYEWEPARSAWQRFEVNLLSLMPVDDEL